MRLRALLRDARLKQKAAFAAFFLLCAFTLIVPQSLG